MLDSVSGRIPHQTGISERSESSDIGSHNKSARRRSKTDDSSTEFSSSDDGSGPPSKLSKVATEQNDGNNEDFITTQSSRWPLTTSISADGEDHSADSIEPAETEEALMAPSTDKMIPRISLSSITEKEDPYRNRQSNTASGPIEEADGSNKDQLPTEQSHAQFKTDARTLVKRKSPSTDITHATAKSPSASESRPDSGATEPAKEPAKEPINPPKPWKGQVLGPMEPMGLSGCQKKVTGNCSQANPPGLPKILDFHNGDSSGHMVIGGAAEREQPLPSLSEDSRLASALAKDPGSPAYSSAKMQRKSYGRNDSIESMHFGSFQPGESTQLLPQQQQLQQQQHRQSDPFLSTESSYSTQSIPPPTVPSHPSENPSHPQQIPEFKHRFSDPYSSSSSTSPFQMIRQNSAGEDKPFSGPTAMVPNDGYPINFPIADPINGPPRHSDFNFYYPPTHDSFNRMYAYPLSSGGHNNESAGSSLSQYTVQNVYPPGGHEFQQPPYLQLQNPLNPQNPQNLQNAQHLQNLQNLQNPQTPHQLHHQDIPQPDQRHNSQTSEGQQHVPNLPRAMEPQNSTSVSSGLDSILANVGGDGSHQVFDKQPYKYRHFVAPATEPSTHNQQLPPAASATHPGYNMGFDRIMAYPVMVESAPETNPVTGKNYHHIQPAPPRIHNEYGSTSLRANYGDKLERGTVQNYDIPNHDGGVGIPSSSATPAEIDSLHRHTQQQQISDSGVRRPTPGSSKSVPLKAHKCTYPGCGWSFARSSDHKRHLRSHEKPSLRCPYWQIEPSCNKKAGMFYRLDVLKRHLRLVHLIRPTDGTEDGGRCRICLNVFPTTRAFVDHCESCAREYSEKHPGQCVEH